MVDDQKDSRATNVESTIGGGAATGGFAQSLLDIYVDPFKVFRRVDAGLAWWKPFIVVCGVAIVLGYLMLPFQRRMIELNPRGLSEEQLQRAVEGFSKFAPVTLIFIPVVLVITYLIAAGIVHLAVNVMSSRSSYRKTLSLMSFCGLITLLEQVIGTVVIKMRGVEGVESAEDLRFSLSLAPLIGSGKGLLNAVLQSLSVFQIWYYVVLVLGIAAIFKVSRKAAAVPAVLIWILSIVLLWVGEKFGGAMR
jgi:hypothetical protein